jgi:hypothetical protein
MGETPAARATSLIVTVDAVIAVLSVPQ